MRRLAGKALQAAVALTLAVAASAQSPWDDALAPLESGKLLVWVVVPPNFGPADAPARVIHSDGKTKVLTPQQAAAAEAASVKAHDDELQHDAKWDILRSRLQRAFPDLDLDFEYLTDRDLAPDLKDALGTDSYPDLVLRSEPWLDAASCKQVRVWLSETIDPGRCVGFRPYIEGVPNAANVGAYSALSVWLADEGVDFGVVERTPENSEAGGIAVKAFARLLQGRALEDADPELVGPALRAAGYVQPAGPPAEVRVNITSIEVSRESAVVTMRGLGALHTMMVLRRDHAGRWRVLHVSWDLAPDLVLNAFAQLASAWSEGASVQRNEGDRPLGISQATPKNGAMAQVNPELWWDNRGGATLQVVEWHPSGSGGDPPTWLYFAPDTDNRLKTGTVARFADHMGPYWWRVWSVGADGTIVLSPWQAMNISGGSR